MSISSSYSSSGSLVYSSPFNHSNSSQSQPDTLPLESSDNSDPAADIENFRSTNAWGILYAINSHLYKNQYLETDEPFIVGRDRDCSYRIDKAVFQEANMLHLHAQFSKRHFKIFKVEDSSDIGFNVRLENLSINPTYVNNYKVEKGCSVLLPNCSIIALTFAHNEAFQFVNVRIMLTEYNSLPINFRKMYDLERIQLGVGATGVVRRGQCKISGKYVAVKMIQKIKSSDFVKDWSYEANLMRGLDHPNIVKVFDVFGSEQMMYIVLEFMNGGELCNYIIVNGPLKEDIAKIKFLDLLRAVSYLHAKNIIHRDLKPENILLSSKDIESCKLKITDFGLSRLVAEHSLMRTICGTPSYIAPEILNASQSGYTGAVDVWSLGCILFIMLSSTPPFSTERNDIALVDAIKTGNYKFVHSIWEDISDYAKALIVKMLTVSPRDRISVENAVSCDWFVNRREALNRNELKRKVVNCTFDC